MSFVGPRPVVAEIAEDLRQQCKRLLAVRPGLTDPATLKYCYECELLAAVPDSLRNFKTVVTPDRLRIFAEYLQNASPLRRSRSHCENCAGNCSAQSRIAAASSL
jgi:lipopolysaccharide/colanic/teichoic acid biosynthesis glycosyltransferase